MHAAATTRFTVRGGARHGGGITVEVDGDLDQAASTGFRWVMQDFAGDTSVRIDLGGCWFIDATGVGALVGSIRRLRDAGTSATVVNVSPLLRSALDAAGVSEYAGLPADRPPLVAATA